MKTTEFAPLKLPTVAEAAWIMTHAADKEMMLSWKLGFHYCVAAGEATELRREHFRSEKLGRPDGFFMQCRNRTKWYVPIRPRDHGLFAALLPEEGPLFKSKDPYGRLVRLAASAGILITRKSIRHACLTYACASGWYHEEVSALARIRFQPWHKHIRQLVSRAEAQHFCSLSPDPELVACLPQYRRNVALHLTK